nr:uncharacterized protein LOC133618800 isoform X3 [Nerophis lumbriciformis]
MSLKQLAPSFDTSSTPVLARYTATTKMTGRRRCRSEMVCTWFRHWYTCVLPRSLCLVQSALSVHPCPVKNFAWNDPNLSRWGRILLRGLFSQDADGTPEARCRRLRKSGRYGSPRTTKADTRKFSGLMQILNTDQKLLQLQLFWEGCPQGCGVCL